jgi:YHS domain-containing protein
MIRCGLIGRLTVPVILACAAGIVVSARGPIHADASVASDVPAEFAPLEYLIGRWNGQATPRDSASQSFRGWSESHAWAWVFKNGRPSGLSCVMTGGKLLSKATLFYEPARQSYRLEATSDKPGEPRLTFEGRLDDSGKMLILDQVRAGQEQVPQNEQLRLSLRPNANRVRYTLWVDRREPGAVPFGRMIEVGLTREGETFAAGSQAAEAARCIVTGGAASLTVSYEGRTFPVCCTGCRDEFNENPDKYLKKAAAMARLQAASPVAARPRTSAVSRFEDAFAADVAGSASTREAPATVRSEFAAGSGTDRNTASPQRSEVEQSKTKTGEARDRDAAKTTSSQASTRAASLLRIGQNLEKSGKPESALRYFRRIVKEFPATPAAKTAARRIKALARQ